MVKNNLLLEEEDVENVNKLLAEINKLVGCNFVDVVNNDDDEQTLDTFVDGNTYDTYSDMDCVISWLYGVKLMAERQVKPHKAYVVLSQDTTDEEGCCASVVSVHASPVSAEKVVARRKVETLKMYEEKIPNIGGSIKVACDTPTCFHIYDENSDNDTQVSISEQTIVF